MSMQFRIIKILTPRNESFNVEISWCEKELLDLISMITGIPEFDIKGIKDCYGTYYTISSVVNNPLINSQYSDAFYLVCTPNHMMQNQTYFNNLNEFNKYKPNKNSLPNTNQKVNPNQSSAINNFSFNQGINSSSNEHLEYNHKTNFSCATIPCQNISMVNSKYVSHARTESSQNSINNRSGNNLNNSKHINSNNINITDNSSNYTAFNLNNSNRQIYVQNYDNNKRSSNNSKPTGRSISKFGKNNLNNIPQYYNSNSYQINNNIISSPNISVDENIINNRNIFHNLTNSFNNMSQQVTNSPTISSFASFISQKETESFTIKGTYNIDKYISIVQGLYDEKQLESRIYSQITQMILKENEEVTNLIKIYLHDIVDKKSFISGLYKIITNNSKLYPRPNSPKLYKTNLIKLIEQLDKEIIFEDKTDFDFIKNLVEYENEFIMGAFEVYESDQDLDNFIESLKILLIRIKRNSYNNTKEYKITQNNLKKNNYTNNRSLLNNSNNIQNNNSNNNAIFNINTQNLTEVKKLEVIGKDSLQEDIKNELYKSKNPQSKSFNISKYVQSYIISNLHTLERIIFKYAVISKLPEIEAIIQLYNTFKKEELLIKPIKALCKKFINEFVLKNLNEEKKLKFFQNLSNKEKNKELVTIFQNFKEHQNTNKLEKEVHMYMNQDQNKKRKRQSSSESESLLCEDESLMKERKGEKSFYKESEIGKYNNKGDEMIQLINIIKFLKPEEKKELEAMVRNKHKQSLEIFENYFKIKNSLALKTSIINLMRKNSFNPLGRQNSDQNSNNSRKNSGSVSYSNKDTTSFILHTNNNESNYDQNKNSSRNGGIFHKLETKANSLNINVCEKNGSSFENLIDEITKSGKITKLQSKYIIQRYKSGDDMVISIWDTYYQNKDLPELIESIKISANINIRKHTSPNPFPITPTDTEAIKKELIINNSCKKEKETVKIMQYNMIKILARDNSINKSALHLLKEMISVENPLLITAFEVFGITKDHMDFSHTLNVIASFHNLNQEEDNKSEVLPFQKDNSKDIFRDTKREYKENSKDSTFNNFENFLNKCTHLTNYEKEILRKNYDKKNINLMSSLELFEINHDDEELIETLNIILKNNNS